MIYIFTLNFGAVEWEWMVVIELVIIIWPNIADTTRFLDVPPPLIGLILIEYIMLSTILSKIEEDHSVHTLRNIFWQNTIVKCLLT